MLNGAAFAGKLKRYDQYFGDKGGVSGGMVVLGALMAMKKKGVRMEIERIKR